MLIETEASWHRRKKRQAVRRTLGERFGNSLYPSSVIAPLIASGALLKVPGPDEVYVKGDYADPEAIGFTNSFVPYVVNTPVGYNVIKSEIELFPLWWARMR